MEKILKIYIFSLYILRTSNRPRRPACTRLRCPRQHQVMGALLLESLHFHFLREEAKKESGRNQSVTAVFPSLPSHFSFLSSQRWKKPFSGAGFVLGIPRRCCHTQMPPRSPPHRAAYIFKVSTPKLTHILCSSVTTEPQWPLLLFSPLGPNRDEFLSHPLPPALVHLPPCRSLFPKTQFDPWAEILVVLLFLPSHQSGLFPCVYFHFPPKSSEANSPG